MGSWRKEPQGIRAEPYRSDRCRRRLCHIVVLGFSGVDFRAGLQVDAQRTRAAAAGSAADPARCLRSRGCLRHGHACRGSLRSTRQMKWS